MQQSFTRSFMQDNYGCYTQNQLNTCSFMKDEILLTDIINSEIPLKDKYWFVCKKVATKEQNQQITIAVAEIVLPIYEKRYNDTRPREAIEAAKQFIAGHITLEQLNIKRDAAAYAHATGYFFADAVYNACIHHAAEAAHDAAAMADVFYDADKQLLDYLINFCK